MALSAVGIFLSLNYIFGSLVYFTEAGKLTNMDEDERWGMMKNVYASFLFLPIAFIRVEIIDFLNWFLLGWGTLVMTVIYRKLPE